MKRPGEVRATDQHLFGIAVRGRRSRSYSLVAACALVAAGGCTRAAHEYDAVVTGTVTIDGELAKSGTIAFHPVKAGKPAIGLISSDGSYSLRTGQGDMAKDDGGTVVSGEYLVTVSITGPAADGAVVGEGGPPKPGPALIDKKYSQKDTTDLRYTVKPGPQVIVLELKRADPEAGDPAKPAGEADKRAEATAGEGVEPSVRQASENATAEPKK